MKRPPVAAAVSQISGSSAFDQGDNDQNDHGADRRVDDRGHDSGAEIDAESRQQPSGYHRADNADDDIPDKPEAAPFDDQSCEPAGDGAYDEPDDNRFDSH
jgi:hypothetical protein